MSNIFDIYRRLEIKDRAFFVRRFPRGSTPWYERQSVLVTSLAPRGGYGKAKGFYYLDGKRGESYWCKENEEKQQEIPCAGCGGWVFVGMSDFPLDLKVPKDYPQINLSLDDAFPIGKYKGKKIRDVIVKDPEYVSWFKDNVKKYIINE